ncbi:MAG: transcription termination/antitermination protein NusG [Christensenellales bacterium]
MIDMNEPQWYVIQTQFGYESIAKTNLLQMVQINGLQDFIFDVVMPEEEDVVEKNGKRKIVKKKKYPNYLFIKMIYTKDVWYMVKQTHGVKDFCKDFSGIPIPMTPEEVKRIQLEKIAVEDLDIKVGDNVNITAGPLVGFIGEVKEIKADVEKIKVSVSMFGRETSIELEFNQVEKL